MPDAAVAETRGARRGARRAFAAGFGRDFAAFFFGLFVLFVRWFRGRIAALLPPRRRRCIARAMIPSCRGDEEIPVLDRLFPNGVERYLEGGLLIGAGVALLFVALGRIGGMSTFFSAIWSWWSRAPGFQREPLLASRRWRLAYAIGLVAGGALWVAMGGATTTTAVPAWRLVVGGLLVGYGARLGGGCTSGHGICGLASLQAPSLLAVLTFLATAMATVRIVAALGAAS
jgi:uncharacterized membrane protein YedE/YeeE